MRPTKVDGMGVQVAPDAYAGVFVAEINNRYYGAATRLRLGGPAVQAAKLSEAALERGDQSLEDFLWPHEGDSSLYTVAPGVEVSFVDFSGGQQLRVTSSEIREMQPATPPTEVN